MKASCIALALIALLYGPRFAAAATPAEALHAVLADYDRYLIEADPVEAGRRGDLEAARRWPDDSQAAVAARHRQLQGFHDRLGAIDPAALAGADALNHALLVRRVDIDLAGDAFDEVRMPFTSDEGFFSLPAYAAQGLRLHSTAEAEAYLARLEALPAFYETETANMRRGLATGFVQPRITATAAAKATRAQADLPSDRSPLLQPFESDRIMLPADQAARFRARALEILRDRVKPAEQALAAFVARDYLPRARAGIGASGLPDGHAYYAYKVRRETTTGLTPDQIFDFGQSEIARIRAAMETAKNAAGFRGSFAEFQQFLRSDPQFYATSREALLEKASRVAKRIDDLLPAYFGKLPRLTYGVRPVPAEIEEGYTSGRYFEGSPDQGVAGGLMINTSHLDQRPLYELPALVAHEGVPGHHIQIALAQELQDVPQFRRIDDLSAFVEGWALYSERLAGEIGVYLTPYERFGQLSMEMWRACRLVIDTGIHWKGWTRDQAVACLKDNTALSDKNIQNEVDRYISWPGQALAYKIGERKLLELRDRARSVLGPRFDIRAFHDAVLDDGAMPLDVLEQQIDAWIKARKG